MTVDEKHEESERPPLFCDRHSEKQMPRKRELATLALAAAAPARPSYDDYDDETAWREAQESWVGAWDGQPLETEASVARRKAWWKQVNKQHRALLADWDGRRDTSTQPSSPGRLARDVRSTRDALVEQRTVPSQCVSAPPIGSASICSDSLGSFGSVLRPPPQFYASQPLSQAPLQMPLTPQQPLMLASFRMAPALVSGFAVPQQFAGSAPLLLRPAPLVPAIWAPMPHMQPMQLASAEWPRAPTASQPRSTPAPVLFPLTQGETQPRADHAAVSSILRPKPSGRAPTVDGAPCTWDSVHGCWMTGGPQPQPHKVVANPGRALASEERRAQAERVDAEAMRQLSVLRERRASDPRVELALHSIRRFGWTTDKVGPNVEIVLNASDVCPGEDMRLWQRLGSIRDDVGFCVVESKRADDWCAASHPTPAPDARAQTTHFLSDIPAFTCATLTTSRLCTRRAKQFTHPFDRTPNFDTISGANDHLKSTSFRGTVCSGASLRGLRCGPRGPMDCLCRHMLIFRGTRLYWECIDMLLEQEPNLSRAQFEHQYPSVLEVRVRRALKEMKEMEPLREREGKWLSRCHPDGSRIMTITKKERERWYSADDKIFEGSGYQDEQFRFQMWLLHDDDAPPAKQHVTSDSAVLEYVRELQTQPNNLLALWQRELVLQRGDEV